MANETTLTIVGNLTADPELRFIPTGDAVANLTIASTPRRYDKTSGGWKDGDALFLRCTAWRQLAENVTDSLTKGARVIATGRLSQRSYEDRDGITRTVVEMTLDDIGPSLQLAVATVKKTTRDSSGDRASVSGRTGAPPNRDADPWAVGADDAPPF